MYFMSSRVHLKKIRSDSENFALHRELINSYKEKGLISIPLEIYKDAVEKHSECPLAFYVLGYAYLVEGSAESLNLAEKNLKKAKFIGKKIAQIMTILKFKNMSEKLKEGR